MWSCRRCLSAVASVLGLFASCASSFVVVVAPHATAIHHNRLVVPLHSSLLAKSRRWRSRIEHSKSTDDYLSSISSSKEESPEPPKQNAMIKFRKRLLRRKHDNDELPFRQRLAKMGLSVLLSYGFVSNVSYCICVSVAWFGFSKKTGLSPLAPGQWKPFLAVYAGFYLFNNIVRPLRVALSVAISTYFDNVVAAVQRKTNLSKGGSIGVVVFLFNVVGTLSFMSLGILSASLLTGVPIFPPKTTL